MWHRSYHNYVIKNSRVISFNEFKCFHLMLILLSPLISIAVDLHCWGIPITTKGLHLQIKKEMLTTYAVYYLRLFYPRSSRLPHWTLFEHTIYLAFLRSDCTYSLVFSTTRKRSFWPSFVNIKFPCINTWPWWIFRYIFVLHYTCKTGAISVLFVT